MTNDDNIIDSNIETENLNENEIHSNLSEPTKTSTFDDTDEDITFEEDTDTRENTAPDAITKINKLKSEIEKIKTEKQQYLDNWQRDKAEFINARKRDDDSKSEFMKFALMGFTEELLPVIDSFESAIKIMKSAESNDLQGIEQIYNQFQSILRRHDVESFGAIGDVFSPSKHQAIGNISTTDQKEDHTLAEILQYGYTISGKVIRPAFVKVFQV